MKQFVIYCLLAISFSVTKGQNLLINGSFEPVPNNMCYGINVTDSLLNNHISGFYSVSILRLVGFPGSHATNDLLHGDSVFCSWAPKWGQPKDGNHFLGIDYHHDVFITSNKFKFVVSQIALKTTEELPEGGFYSLRYYRKLHPKFLDSTKNLLPGTILFGYSIDSSSFGHRFASHVYDIADNEWRQFSFTFQPVQPFQWITFMHDTSLFPIDTPGSIGNWSNLDHFELFYCGEQVLWEADTILQYGQSVYAAGAWQSLPGTYRDTFHRANGCDSIVTLRVTVVGTIPDLAESPPLIYPNPAATTLYLRHSHTNATFRLYNKLGQVVLEQQNLPPGTAAVSLKGLAEGIYFWEITAGGTAARGKILRLELE